MQDEGLVNMKQVEDYIKSKQEDEVKAQSKN
jgi:hypothetical protein